MAVSPAAETALRFTGVSKAYGTTPALRDFTLSIAGGTLFGLVGGNGAGKTTLIKCLLDFSTPDSGEIAIFGVAHTATASRADLAYLPERFNPPHYLTGRDFLRYMGALHRTPYDEGLVTETFARLDLDATAL